MLGNNWISANQRKSCPEPWQQVPTLTTLLSADESSKFCTRAAGGHAGVLHVAGPAGSSDAALGPCLQAQPNPGRCRREPRTAPGLPLRLWGPSCPEGLAVPSATPRHPAGCPVLTTVTANEQQKSPRQR